jgi:hypothetical protein
MDLRYEILILALYKLSLSPFVQQVSLIRPHLEGMVPIGISSFLKLMQKEEKNHVVSSFIVLSSKDIWMVIDNVLEVWI